MVGTFFEQFDHFATIGISNVLAIVSIFVILSMLKRAGCHLPCDPSEMLQVLTALSDRTSRSRVNVEFRDAGGKTMDLGEFVPATMRNFQGRPFRYEDGFFRGCHRKLVPAGAEVLVNTGGHVRETLFVQVDPEKHTLFVQSTFTEKEIFDQVNHKHPQCFGRPS